MAATIDQFRELLESDVTFEFVKLINIAKHGVPTKVRGEVWKYLLEVAKPDKSEEMKLQRRQNQEYREIDKSISADIRNSIKNQISRSYSKTPFFQQEEVQTLMQNALCAYCNYHSQFDFSRGIISLLGPLVYSLKDEAQVFWCFEALMKKLESHFAQDSLQDKLSRFMMYFRSVNPELYNYFEEEELLPNEWAMSWLKYLLSNELPLECVLRLWDTYFAGPDGLDLHIYVCIAILKNCTEELMELEISELKSFLQRLPSMDMDEIISQAYNIRD
eukprot:TRINITY_DN4957_c0_g1_i1.p1 TRINITY_DN4957_c0_g1~~TRINITY_DN4957_c0_g1_i1.p1  ORF type:complete len:275 (-),score=58.81 TRINITY_DN4957_c0_g1_i1:88-912(-)